MPSDSSPRATCARSLARSRWTLPALAYLALGSLPASAQSVHRFDMGVEGASSPVAPGFTEVLKSDVYTPGSFGWIDSPAADFAAAPHAHAVHTFGDAQDRLNLLVDGVEDNEMTFRLDLPNGDYDCVVYLGNPGFADVTGTGQSTGGAPRVQTDVFANGVQVADDVYALTVIHKNAYKNAIGGYRKVRFIASVTNGTKGKDGYLDIRIEHDDVNPPGPSHWEFMPSDLASLLAIEVYEHQTPPVLLSNGKLSVAPGTTPLLKTAVSAFNSVTDASVVSYGTSLLTLQLNGGVTPLEKAWFYAWYVGWMRGEAEVVTEGDKQLLADARTALEGLNQDDSRVALLLDQLNDFELGAHYTEARGYPGAVYPGLPVAHIVYRLSAAMHLLWQMSDDYLAGTPRTYETESPFYAKARYLTARNMHGRNTYLSEVVTRPFNDLWWTQIYAGEFSDLTDVQALYPRDIELQVITHYFNAYVTVNPQGVLKATWSPPPAGLFNMDHAWWRDLVTAPPPSSGTPAPVWAERQYQTTRMQRAVGEWWLDNRLKTAGVYDPVTGGFSEDVSLGTGAGDDVELAGHFMQLGLTVHMPDHPLETVMLSALDNILHREQKVNVDEGYQQTPEDVEHSAEVTSFSLYALMQLRYGDPRYVEFAERLMSNMVDTGPGADQASWTRSRNVGGQVHRHFRSFVFGAEALGGGGPTDTPINTRALMPGYLLTAFNDSPGARTLLLEYARAWAAAAMWDSSIGKPVGVFPGSVKTTVNPPTYGYSEWWVNKQNGSEYFSLSKEAKQYYRSLYSLLVYAYKDTPELELLEPIAHAAVFLDASNPSENAAVGSADWAAFLLKGAIATAVFNTRDDLLLHFGNGPSPLVNGPLLRGLIDDYAGARGDLEDVTPPNGKDKSVVESKYSAALEWLPTYFPFATSAVMYTDRVNNKYTKVYATHATGAPQNTSVPEFLVRWADPGNPNNADDVLDVGIFLNELRSDYLRVLVYNFEDDPIDLDMSIVAGMDAGDYSLIVSLDVDGNEHPDTLVSTTPIELSEQGQVVGVTAIPNHVPVIIELDRDPNSTATSLSQSYWDVGISPLDVRRDSSDNLVVTVHNVGSLDNQACGTITVTDMGGGGAQHTVNLPFIPAQGDYTSSQFMYDPGTNHPTPKTVDVVIPGTDNVEEFTVDIDTTDCMGMGVKERTNANNSLSLDLPLLP